MNPQIEIPYTDLLTFRIIKAEVFIKRRLVAEFQSKGYDITFEQWTILSVIYHHPGIIQSELAERCYKDKTNVTRILDVLCKNGYVERRPHATDRRSIQIFLSDVGQKMLDTLTPISVDLNKRFQNSIPERDYQTFLTVLDKLFNSIIDQPPETIPQKGDSQ